MCVISDTHYTRNGRLPSHVFDSVRNEEPDLIVHCGDVIDPELLEELEGISPVVAVRGNADYLNLPESRIVEADGVRIGAVHGHDVIPLNAQTLAYKALEMEVDVLLFGHTHRFYSDRISFHGREILLLNPGSPTKPRFDSPGFAMIRTPSMDVRRVELWS
ncbi:MAG: metallophosphoesterase [Thermococci archaeon]|nr:metallophosphoesterase [Thermococci archaeon]